MKKYLHVSGFNSTAIILYKDKLLKSESYAGDIIKFSDGSVEDILSGITIYPKIGCSNLYFKLYGSDNHYALECVSYENIKNNFDIPDYSWYCVVDSKLVKLSNIPNASKSDVYNMVANALNRELRTILFKLIVRLVNKDILNKVDFQELFNLNDSEVDLLIKK